MYEQSRLPGALAPLNDLKGRYLEVVNPLLSRRVIGAVHELPDELRAYGRAYAQVVDGESRPIPYARFTSTRAVDDCLDDPGVVGAVVRELTSPRAERVSTKRRCCAFSRPWPHRAGGVRRCGTVRWPPSGWRGPPCRKTWGGA